MLELEDEGNTLLRNAGKGQPVTVTYIAEDLNLKLERFSSHRTVSTPSPLQKTVD
jgi:ABC-type ATPase with predicted acetyltransferase domain